MHGESYHRSKLQANLARQFRSSNTSSSGGTVIIPIHRDGHGLLLRRRNNNKHVWDIYYSTLMWGGGCTDDGAVQPLLTMNTRDGSFTVQHLSHTDVSKNPKLVEALFNLTGSAFYVVSKYITSPLRIYQPGSNPELASQYKPPHCGAVHGTKFLYGGEILNPPEDRVMAVSRSKIKRCMFNTLVSHASSMLLVVGPRTLDNGAVSMGLQDAGLRWAVSEVSNSQWVIANSCSTAAIKTFLIANHTGERIGLMNLPSYKRTTILTALSNTDTSNLPAITATAFDIATMASYIPKATYYSVSSLIPCTSGPSCSRDHWLQVACAVATNRFYLRKVKASK